MSQELAERTEAGIIVRLLWDQPRDQVIVEYRDDRSGDQFSVIVPKSQALSAFHHPNAYRSPRPKASS
ncbi:MAG: hypothetical protein ACXVJS_19300 [Acidimicrobiia bacterium]